MFSLLCKSFIFKKEEKNNTLTHTENLYYHIQCTRLPRNTGFRKALKPPPIYLYSLRNILIVTYTNTNRYHRPGPHVKEAGVLKTENILPTTGDTLLKIQFSD